MEIEIQNDSGEMLRIKVTKRGVVTINGNTFSKRFSTVSAAKKYAKKDIELVGEADALDTFLLSLED